MSSKYQHWIATVLFGYAALTLAEAPPSAPTKESREKMAQAHEKMAACLRSDRDMAECHGEMKKSCKENMGEKGCKMGMMGEHQGHSGKQAAPASTKSPPTTK